MIFFKNDSKLAANRINPEDKMKKAKSENGAGSEEVAAKLKQEYDRLSQQLLEIGYISQGSAIKRKKDAEKRLTGSPYMWTRKEQKKTISVSLSKEQYEWLRKAIANQRKMEKTIRKLHQISHRILFETVPGVQRRKKLDRRTLDMN